MQLIFQDPYASLDPRKTVSEIIAEPLKLQKLITDPKARMDRVRELMQVVGLADRLINTYPHELDGGRRQRIGIARALAMEPEILLFDEPTSALDPQMVGEVLEVMRTLAKDGLTMIIVTHEMAFARDVAKHVIFMGNGVIVEEGTSQQIFEDPQNEMTKEFLSRFRNA